VNTPMTFDDRVNHWEGMEIDASGCWLRKDVAPGASAWTTDFAGNLAVLRFSCPCGCGYVVSVPIKPFDVRGWSWDGDKEKPTLTPSIQKLSGCRWHGHLTKGVFETA